MSKKHCLSLQLGVFALVLTQGFGSVADASLIANWSGNGNANDSVGGHNGTLVNGTGFGTGQFGQQAFKLNGTNQYVSVPNSPAWDFGSNPFTIALWANFNAISNRAFSAGGNLFIGDDNGLGDQNKWFFSYLSDGSLGFHINSPSLGPIFLTSPVQLPVNTGEWNLFAVTKSGNTYTFYENGSSLGSVTNPNAIPSPSANLTIGQAENAGYIDGLLQNVQIYNQALSAAQIEQLAAAPEPACITMLASGLFAAGGFGLYRRRRVKPAI
jgi:hypothetical protein